MAQDILMPLQVSAEGMNPRDLKLEFGSRLCFHGRADTQYFLPFAAPGRVPEQVRFLAVYSARTADTSELVARTFWQAYNWTMSWQCMMRRANTSAGWALLRTHDIGCPGGELA